MDIQFMKDYYDLRYEETDGENHFVEETAYQEKQSEQSKLEDQLMEMVGGSESKALCNRLLHKVTHKTAGKRWSDTTRIVYMDTPAVRHRTGIPLA